MNTSTRSTWIIAGAVVFAGLLIAAGIFFGDQSSGDDTEATNNDGVVAAAEAADVDMEEFESCLSSDNFQSEVEADVNDAAQAGGQGTPFNVLVLNDPLSSETATQITDLIGSIEISQDNRRVAVAGAVPYNALTQIIDLILEDPDSSADAESSDDIAVAEITDEDHIRGETDAEVVVVEYSDFLCPYCTQFHDTMKQVVDTYDPQEVSWIYRHLPIPQLHPEAPRYAQASECVADIGGNDAFWSYADHVFANQ